MSSPPSSPPPPSSPLTALSCTPPISPSSSPFASGCIFDLSLDLTKSTDASKRYPSPSSTAESSRSQSPVKRSRKSSRDADEICVNTDNMPTDGPPPAKRRKLSTPKPRTTEYIDLEKSVEHRTFDEESSLDRILHALRKKKKIVVVAGAGISVSAGIPDFRSSTGLFTTLKSQHKLKASGKHLFDASVYKHDDSTQSFHDMVRQLAHLTDNAEPTPFHHMLASLAKEGRLMRLYSQNVDGLDTSMPPLATSIPLTQKGPWPVTVQLHGGLSNMVCTKCHDLQPFESSLFEGPEPPLCEHCKVMDALRTEYGGKRSHGIGRLRPRIVLYNEYNPDEDAIGNVSQADLRKGPDAVVVVGTSLKIPGVRRLVRELCLKTRSRRDGITMWLNMDAEPQGVEFRDCWDYVVRGSCDDVAGLAALPRWDDATGVNDVALTEPEHKLRDERLNRDKVEVQLLQKHAAGDDDNGDNDDDDDDDDNGLDRALAATVTTPRKSRGINSTKGMLTPKPSPKLEAKQSVPLKQGKLAFKGQTNKTSAAPPASKKPPQPKGRKPRTATVPINNKQTVLQTFKATKSKVANVLASKKLDLPAPPASDPIMPEDDHNVVPATRALPSLRPTLSLGNIRNTAQRRQTITTPVRAVGKRTPLPTSR